MQVIVRIILSVVLVLSVGLVLGGAWLKILGGTWYYVSIGLLYCLATVLLFKQKALGAWLFLLALVVTIPWAVWESNQQYWGLFPRLMVPLGLALLALLYAPHLPSVEHSVFFYAPAVLVGIAFVVMLGLAFVPHDVIQSNAPRQYVTVSRGNKPSDWSAYAKTTAGQRYAEFNQIKGQTVKKLKLAWTYHSGYKGQGVDQNTPLMVDDMVYSCTPENKISALDADTGQVRWTFDPKASSPIWQRCRGLGYYDAKQPLDPSGKPAICSTRIVQTTIDARLIELDAKTGQPCPGFGQNGVVALSQGMGEIKPGYYFQTSAPLVARDYIVIGGWVVDNQSRGEPSGVIRAFDARSGDLVWAWDLGNPDITKFPPEGQTYTRGTPNMWTAAAYDDRLGLIYAPLGNATPDYYGRNRPPYSEAYNSTLVALDVMTGRERWRFQTVHHDIWDYDLPAQPALIDLPDGTPAVIQSTKRGQLFFLNRETGQPLSKVQEKPAPQNGAVPEETLAKTQPYSIDMPTIGAETLTEAKTWGMTMYDHLYCRIDFLRHRYDGDFTPIGLKKALQQPGNTGGMNWGSLSVDPVNQLIFMNDLRIPSSYFLIPRQEYASSKLKFPPVPDGHGPSPMSGTPYGEVTNLWLSPFGVPCNQPPYGTLTAVDLKTKLIAWQVPVGTTKETGPFGWKSHLPMQIGMPTYAGTLTTAGGLVFFAGTQDYYLRAFDIESGKQIWEYPLPVGASATPMTYISPKTGKQYIVLSVGGAAHSKDQGDYLMAFALPK